MSSSTRRSHSALESHFGDTNVVSLPAKRFFGFDLANGEATVSGLGDAPISFTGRPDIARYVGFVFTTLPAEELEWKAFRLEGERTVGTIHALVL